MREIKFRAWDNIKKKMLQNTNLLYPAISLNGGIIAYKGDEKIPDTIAESRFILMQYTGLKDKNGKEIYEGDIVEWKYLKTWHKNEVRLVGGGFVITTSGFKDDLNEPQDLSLVSILNCEIIGNIYENPELLTPNTQ